MQLPEFPHFREVSLDLAGEVRSRFRALHPEIAEFCFGNLYLFRTIHAYRVSVWQGFLLVTGRGYDGAPYAFPPMGQGDIEGASRLLCDYLASQGHQPLLFPVPQSVLETSFSTPAWQAVADRDQADYVYLRQDLATLPGKKFHKRKNRLNKFLKEHPAGYGFSELGDEHVAQCMDLASGWCVIRCSEDRYSTYQETDAAREALLHRTALGLRGGVITLEGRVAAFCLGEELNPETFVMHFEKADPGIEGLAQVINRDFCLHALSPYRYVNREQDLGDPGLRRAKEAYNPVALMDKYRVRPA